MSRNVYFITNFTDINNLLSCKPCFTCTFNININDINLYRYRIERILFWNKTINSKSNFKSIVKTFVSKFLQDVCNLNSTSSLASPTWLSSIVHGVSECTASYDLFPCNQSFYMPTLTKFGFTEWPISFLPNYNWS